MITGTASRAGAMATASVILIGAAIVRGNTAAADPSQDEQFLALLDQHGIPALQNPASLVVTAQNVCRELDGGKPFDAVVESMATFAYDSDPGRYPRDRLTRTFTRFVTAAVQAYCPYNQNKLAAFSTRRTPGLIEPAHRTFTAAARLPQPTIGGVYVAGRSGIARPDPNEQSAFRAPLIQTFPAGETVAPQPPQIPPQSPPPGHIVTPPRAPATPQPPRQPPAIPQQQPPPPPQEPPPPPEEPPPPQQLEPPPPQQVEPPSAAPQPGGGVGGDGTGGGGAGTGGGGTGGGGSGGGGTGGHGPSGPAPARPMPPGIVQVAP
ncbi:hypothetical protein BST12_24720 [Mycobacterium angelicum]|uniref:DUF732 domain-containing protein n=2 Tax=Mycobacterium angelicum TaxID=470074 RepID=A0A1W9ZDF8_MYCAN|nr:DUF732 domain-containing protein [Mycobacterium angelicum]ORA12712.1 hypothetical protein BST12_24720 [Mycobacterium angelicum]